MGGKGYLIISRCKWHACMSKALLVMGLAVEEYQMVLAAPLKAIMGRTLLINSLEHHWDHFIAQLAMGRTLLNDGY